MKVEKLVEIIGADFYSGVPDSQLKALCNYLMATYGIDQKHHIIAANEERGERLTVQEAKDIARSNFSYFSGYYNNETARLIHESYFKEQ